MGFPKGRRRIVLVVAALLVTAAVAATVYRVLAPAEVSTVAQAAYPAAPQPPVGVVGRLPAAPLIVDGRLRVYAAHRQVYADRPVDFRHRTTPYWSYRRWPAELVGVVVSGTTVVSRWSDGRLVALDARTGAVAWRADGPRPAEQPSARRTGAAIVWSPPGLYLTRVADGRGVVVATGSGEARAVALGDGRELWRTDLVGACRTDVGTTATGQLVGVDACAGPATVEFRDAATGAVTGRWRPPGAGDELAVTPVGCRTGRSECPALRTAGPGDAAGRGWLLGSGDPLAAPALDGRDVELVGDQAVTVADGVLVGRSARTGEELWRRPDLGPGRVIAVQTGRVHLLTDARALITVDPATGAERSRFSLTVGQDGTGYAPGAAYAADGYLVVERLREPVDPDADDQGYFFTSEPLVLAAT
ncbi:PQQ-binding-like beta-propeller repeat protein [Micromonospora krabiensis]|uniref:Outer membrane protein assembly factor BamB, contains PQQ-like beta-propeller repeat n=1 Tax=Micromonospora krabiensis TaxID=307121 RepID=A0A1C3N9I1_9ACTN|nr:PQQ-binding-like beta-propeller repeat protein [Micromonospora krabiensis]SBV29242.1 Outer membrane protein assembly factor BamB, contains PQQ-like beta-propeller repeat [Micromonospora krabiensis]